MDGEIDIEEHDILEHPQVKATFPDLTRIQIEVHASGAAFSDNDRDLCNEESTEDFLQERRIYTESSQDNVEVRQGGYQSSTEDDSNLEARQDDEQSNPEDRLVQRYAEDGGDGDTEVRQEEMQSFAEECQDSTGRPDRDLVNTDLEPDCTEIGQEYAEVNQNGAVAGQDVAEIRKRMRNNLQECERFEALMEQNMHLSEVIEIPDDEDPEMLTDVEPQMLTELEPQMLTELEPQMLTELEPQMLTELEPQMLTELEPQVLTEMEPQMLTEVEPRIFDDTYNIRSSRITENENISQNEGLETTENEFIVPDVLGAVENQNMDLTESETNECLEIRNNFNETDAISGKLIGDNADDEIQSVYVRDGTANSEGDKYFAEYPASMESEDSDRKESPTGIEEFTENSEILDPEEINERLEDIEHTDNNEEENEYSNPECNDVPIKEELDDWFEFSDFNETLPTASYNSEEFEPEDMYCFKNKIILGSKPSANIDINCENLMSAQVLLEDWSPRLNNSDSFCKDCNRLFTTPNALDAHKMISHSLLTPITNRAVKSTAKSHIVTSHSNKHTARKSTSAASNSTYCNHCNKTFIDRTSLITHLYKLLPSKKLSCTECDMKFQNQNDLVKHNEVHVKTDRIILKLKSNPLLKKLLKKKQSLPVIKTETPVVVKKELPESIYIFKCMLCSKILENYSLARYHRHDVHPETATQMIFKRMLSKKIEYKDRLVFEEKRAKVKKVDIEGLNAAEDYDLIPKSVLFKCADCNVHFLSSFAGAAHYRNCRSETVTIRYKYRLWQCSICRRKLRKNDKDYHEKQHKMSSKFKIYVITRTSNERTLCKCSRCHVHFDYLSFRPHMAKCGKLLTVKCQQCNILIRKQKEAEHQAKHSRGKLKPKDFIMIDYAVLKKSGESTAIEEKPEDKVKVATASSRNKILVGKIEPKPIKIKTEPRTVKGTKFINRLKFEQNKIKMYYCKWCKNFMHYLCETNVERAMKCHASKSCSSRGHICEQCGLRIHSHWQATETHTRMHKERQITITDFQFHDIRTKKQIPPQIPKHFACQTCNIHFINSTFLTNHICGEDYENCDVCGDKYEMTALALHRPFHDLLNTKTPSPITKTDNTIPELIMKYESLNAIWNILFICARCDLVTDVYNKAVEHSQAHLNHKHNTKTIKCYICSLKFDENCWSKHSELHSRRTLNNKDFKILKYDPKTLLDESWFQMFDSLPESEIRQIIDRSVFGGERGVKMQLVKDGLPEFTIHCCSECEVAFDCNDIRSHVNSPCILSAHICIKCNIAFGKSDSLAFHELLHKKGIKTSEFRVVNFIKDSDVATKKKKVPKGVEAKVKKPKATMAKVQKETKSNVVKVNNPNAKYILYKCKLCSSCLHTAGRMRGHKCDPKHLAFCDYCHQHFNSRLISSHRFKHSSYVDFTPDNINIFKFDPSKTKRKNEIAIAVQNTERKTLNSSKNRSLDIEDTTNDVNTSKNKMNNERKTLNSSKIRSLDIEDATNEINTSKNVNNSDIEQNTTKNKPYKRKTMNSSKHDLAEDDTNVDNERTAKVYKCDCGLHYMSLGSIEKHIETCDNVDSISGQNCSKCGLLFPTDILVSHLCKHHSNLQIEIKVEEVQKKRKSPTAPEDTNKKLYKCSACNVHFLNQNSCSKHITRHEPLDPKEYIECKMCSLQFRILTLHVHIKKHHQKEFDLQTVLVEEYQPSIGNGAPKIELYFASERCQSVQVSSSNDD